MSNQIPCYVINLASATQRRQAMETRLQQQGVHAQFFPAVDGRLMDSSELEKQVDRAKAEIEYGQLTPAEIGTSLSHIHIYREMVQRNTACAVILEDDVCLSADFSNLLSADSPDGLAQSVNPHVPIMIQLTYVRRAYRGSRIRIGNTRRKIVHPYGAIWLTSGYFITLAAAKNLAVNLYPVWTVADHWIRFQEKSLLTLRALTPNAVWESVEAQNSSISPERQPRRMPAKTLATRIQRLKHELIIKPLFVQRLRPSGTPNDEDMGTNGAQAIESV